MKPIRIIALLTVFVLTVSGLSYKPVPTFEDASQTTTYKTLKKERTSSASTTKGYKKPSMDLNAL